jgi:hypothetical protein
LDTSKARSHRENPENADCQFARSMPVALRYGSSSVHTFPHVVGAPFSLFFLFNLSALKATRPTDDQNLTTCSDDLRETLLAARPNIAI